MRARNLFGLLAAVSAVGASMAVTGLSDGPIRALATLSFLLVGPGLALVPLLRLDGVLAPAVAVVAASVVLDGVIAETLVLARAWSPTLGLGILVTMKYALRAPAAAAIRSSVRTGSAIASRRTVLVSRERAS